MPAFPISLLPVLFMTTIAVPSAPSFSSRSQVNSVLANDPRVSISKNGSKGILSELEQAKKTVQRHTSAGSSSCPKCNLKEPVVGSELYQLRLQMIKVQILNKLHMDKEPTGINRPDVSLPEPLADLNTHDQPAVQPNDKKNQIIVMGEKVIEDIPKTDAKSSVVKKLSLKFRFTEKVYTSSVGSAFLWLRKRKSADLDEYNMRIDIVGNFAGNQDSPNKIKRLNTSVQARSGWFVIDLQQVVQDWIEEDRSKNAPASTSFLHALEVSCTNCQSPPGSLLATRSKYGPFLVIDVVGNDTETTRRTKRSIVCQPHVKDCCKQRFYVSFKALNWSNWVVQPKGFYANYCRGSCRGPYATKYHHTFIMRKMAIYRAELEPCCAPTKLSGLSLLFFDSSSDTLLKTDLTDMRVEECGCT